MRAVLFDLGNTLLDDNNTPQPGATELLTAIADLRDPDGVPVPLGVMCDYRPTPSAGVQRKEACYRTLRAARLDRFFQPLDRRVTLSSEVGVGIPDPRIFRAAINRLQPGADFHHVVFVTENLDHVRAARELGMMAIHFTGPGQTTREVDRYTDLVPLLRRMVAFSPCSKKRGEAVRRGASLARKNKTTDPAVATLTAGISTSRLRARIKALTDFGTRWTYSSGVARTSDWVRAEFRGMGYTDAEVRFQDFDVSGGARQRNVLCGPARDHPGFLLLCAHYDSLSESPSTTAPGADDNATGVAVLLEAAELLRGAQLRRGVLFAAFGGEEQGLFGSSACADIAAAEGWRIHLVVNMDMIGYQDPERPGHVVVEYDQGNRHPGNDRAANVFGLLMAQAAADYTSLVVEHTDIWNSDYMPFEAKGYPCIGVFEAAENPDYHKTTDTAEGLDMDHLAEIAKMVVAIVYQVTRSSE